MITKNLKTTSGKIKVSIPSNLNELTVGQMIVINTTEDLTDIKAISILSGVTFEVLKNVIDYREFSQFIEHIKSLAHQISYVYKGAAVPEYIYFGKNKVAVIKNLSVEPAGATLASQNIIADEINRHISIYGEENWKDNFNPDLDAIAMVLAHYFYWRVTGNIWEEHAVELFKAEILKLPMQVVLPIGRHFFLNYPNLLKQRISFWDRVRQKLNEKPASRRLRRSHSTTQ